MKLDIRSLTLLLGLATLVAGLSGCGEPNLTQESESYKKLPPGEGERRLKETLAKRSGKQPPARPASGQ